MHKRSATLLICNDLPECPTVRTSMGSDPRRRASSISEFSGLRSSNLEQESEEVSGKHTVSGPPELRRRSCFFLRPAFPFRLVCLVSSPLLSPAILGGKSVGAEPRLWYCFNEYVSVGAVVSTRLSSSKPTTSKHNYFKSGF